MSEEQADALDNILENLVVPKRVPLDDLKGKVNIGNEDFYLLLEILHAAGHIGHYGADAIAEISAPGFTFIKNGGYMRQFQLDQLATKTLLVSKESLQVIKDLKANAQKIRDGVWVKKTTYD